MKQSVTHICAVILLLSVFLFLSFPSVSAQTNFVKYAGNPMMSAYGFRWFSLMDRFTKCVIPDL